MSADREFAELKDRVEGLERLVEELDDKLDDKLARLLDEVAALNLRLAAVTEWVADVAAASS